MGNISTSTEDKIERVTIPGVELVRVGTWGGRPLSDDAKERAEKDDGIKFDAALIQAMSDAANDPEVDLAPIKFGHFDPRFDGEPAPGWIKNVRVSEGGDVLLGDIVDVPKKIYPLLRDGFKRRSIEFDYDVETPGGKTYAAALTAVALLGVQAPAVKDLNELADIYLSAKDTAKFPHPDAIASDDSNNEAGTGEGNNEGDNTVDIIEQIKEKLGLEADADDAAVIAALEALIAEKAAADAGASANDEGGAALSAAGVETVTVSKDIFASMQSDLLELKEQAAARSIKETIGAALSEGKITTAEAPFYEASLKAAPAATGALLSQLPAQKVRTIATPEGDALGAVDPKAAAEAWKNRNKR